MTAAPEMGRPPLHVTRHLVQLAHEVDTPRESPRVTSGDRSLHDRILSSGRIFRVQHPARPLMLGVFATCLATLVVAPLAAAPLALGWNRNR